MTNNFKILEDFRFSKYQDEIIKCVNKIEEFILEDEFKKGLFVEGRLILEILFNEHKSKNIKKEIDELANIMKDFTNMQIVPTKVKNAFYTIKSEANSVLHIAKETDKPYVLKQDKYSCIQFLKQIFITLKYFVVQFGENWSDSFETEYNFNSKIYDHNIDVEIPKISEEDVSPSSDSLISKTKGIFELICSNYSFLIPTYQRLYTWTKENVDIFFQDIIDRKNDKKMHYLGSLAIAVDQKNKVLRLIDGQQRITTSLLLIKAMIKRFKESKILKMPKELEDLNEKIEKKYINKSSNYGDISHIETILRGIDLSDKGFQKSNAYRNFKLINDNLSKQTDEYFEEFYATFVYNFVIVELKFKNDLENEIQIFENLNSKGMELSQWDLIKNYIFKNIETSFLIKNEKEVEKMIKKMFEIHVSKYFENSEKKQKEISNFFTLYCRIKYKDEGKGVLSDKGKIHKIFKSVWPSKKAKLSNNKINSLEMLRRELIEIAKYFSIYLEMKSGQYKNISSPLFEFKLSIENTSQKDTHYPLIMKAFYISFEFTNNFEIKKIKSNRKKDLLILSESIEKYLIRLIVSNNKGQSLSNFFDRCISNEIKEMCDLFIENIRIKDTGNSLPSLVDFKKSLEEKNDWQVVYATAILRRLEAMPENINNQRFFIILNSSLEHIFPQKPKDDSFWKNQYANMNNKEFNEKRSSHVNMIGNYIILSQKINRKALNHDFSIKKKEYQKDKESKLINGNFTSGKIMNLLEKERFTFEDIEERSKQLANLIVPLYRMDFE